MAKPKKPAVAKVPMLQGMRRMPAPKMPSLPKMTQMPKQ